MRFNDGRRGLGVQVARLHRAWLALPSLLDELGVLGSADGQASGDTRELLSEVAGVAVHIEAIVARASRDTFNIGVIGRTRAGKSTLLRTISGLSRDVIPSGDYFPTTAAFTEIIDTEGPAHAEVALLTWDEFREDYLAPLHRGAGFRALAPNTPEEFRDFPYESNLESEQVSRRRYLQRLRVAQESLASYLPLLTGPERELRIEKLADLRPFTTYPEDLADRERAYHAVRGIRIYSRFAFSGAPRLALIDLPGMGEAGLGADRSFLSVARNKVDVLLQVLRPSESNAYFSDADWEILSLADELRLGADRSDFIGLVINRDPHAGQSVLTNIISDIQTIADSNGVRLFIVDVLDPRDVRDNLLVPLLDGLDERLSEMDQAMVQNVASRALDVVELAQVMAESLVAEASRREGHGPDEQQELRERFMRPFYEVLAALADLGVTRDRAASDDDSTLELTSAHTTVRSRRTAPRVHAGFAPDSPAGQDLLGVENDVATLCQVMLAQDVDPPISVGLFGDWGTGKSFFMSQMRQYVDRLTTESRRARLEGGRTGFCSEVRQVVFNAWHYMDANLWATLAGTIFDSLADPDDPYRVESILQELDSVRSIRDELNRRRAEAEKYAEVVDQSLREQRIGLADLSYAARIPVNEQLLTDKLQEELKDQLREAGVRPDQLAQLDLRRLRQQLRGLRGIAFMLRRGTWPTRLVVLGALTIAVLGTVGFSLALRHVVQAGWAVVIGFVASTIPAVALVSRVLDKMSQISNLAQDVVHRVDEKRQAPIRARQQALARLVDQYEEQIIATTARIELLEGSRSARTFIEQRHAKGEYRRHEGVVSAVRRDLEQLSRLLRPASPPGSQQGLAAAKEVPEVDRIILYIDDLDRCPSEHVVKVLQAIHLLLAFPLFVVVVGVDARWLLRALRQHYRELLDERQTREGIDSIDLPASQATDPVSMSYDYLEKIFQIPICLRPMSARGYSDLIRNLVSGHRTQLSPAQFGSADAESAPVVAPEKRSASTESQQPSLPASSASPKRTEIPGPIPMMTVGEPLKPTQDGNGASARRVSSIRHGARVVAVGTEAVGTHCCRST